MDGTRFTEAQAAGLWRARAAAQLPAEPYDFRHPPASDPQEPRAGGDPLRGFLALNEAVAGRFSAALGTLLRSEVHVALAGLDQLTWGEFFSGLHQPGCCGMFQAEPRQEPVVLELAPPLLFPMMDRLLGGGRDGGACCPRSLTAVEQRIVGRVVHLLADALHTAWSGAFDLNLGEARLESEPPSPRAVSPADVVVVVRMEVTAGEARGTLRLAVPYAALERNRGTLASLLPAAPQAAAATTESARQVGEALRGSVVSMTVRLAHTRITTRDLLGLRVGDIIATEKGVRNPLLVLVENVPKFRATPGTLKGRKAIRIHEVIADPAEAVGE